MSMSSLGWLADGGAELAGNPKYFGHPGFGRHVSGREILEAENYEQDVIDGNEKRREFPSRKCYPVRNRTRKTRICRR
jgi:hypothetical protein